MRVLLLIFIVVPITEMWILIEVGSVIGAFNTIALVFLTAILGAALLRQQGLDTLLRVNQRIESGQLPAAEIIEGIMLAVGGALLLTPGFVTDLIGFSCLLPWSRRWLSGLLLKRGVLNTMSPGGGAGFSYQHRSRYHNKNSHKDPLSDKTDKVFESNNKHSSPTTIDGEFTRED